MHSSRRSEFIDNANLIRLTNERGAQLLELGRQTAAIANLSADSYRNRLGQVVPRQESLG